MTRSLPDRFVEDRALRDAARTVLTEDIDRLRASLGEEGIASRVSSSVGSTVSGRIRTGARDVLAQARAQAGDHAGVLSVLIGAIILWFGREPIIDWLGELYDSESADPADSDSDAAPQDPDFSGDPA